MASAAGAIRRQWNGAETLSITARLMPRPVAMPTARSTAGRSPESTTWPPPLSLATSQTAPSPASSAAASATERAASRSVPISAAMAPAPGATAACMASPRRRRSLAASATVRLPAAASAAYSPSEWPATQATSRARSRPRSASSTRSTARLAAIRAGWALVVRVSSSTGPANISRDRFWPRAASTSSSTARACGKASARSRAMPTAWLPWPGKMSARMLRPDRRRRAARERRPCRPKLWNGARTRTRGPGCQQCAAP